MMEEQWVKEREHQRAENEKWKAEWKAEQEAILDRQRHADEYANEILMRSETYTPLGMCKFSGFSFFFDAADHWDSFM